MKVAIASGKGGTGKTTIAVNLASLIVKNSKQVCYADCDVEEPNGHLFLNPIIDRQWPAVIPIPVVDEKLCDACGKCKDICEFSAITVIVDKVLVFPELCHGCGGCELVCPPKAITESPREIGVVMIGHKGNLQYVSGKLNIGEPSAAPVIRDVKKAFAEYQDVIIDAPPGTACPMVETVSDADYVFLVTEPTPFGLNDLSLAVETVRKLDIPYSVIINRAGSGDNKVQEYCQRENIPITAEIPDDRRIAESYSKGKIIYEALPEYKIYFENIINEITKWQKNIERVTK
ncbi:MAG: ATP-binding protein [candidate division Zixibacteria bacterium]|nr:ATP-binding protein [candidate division Zixibacteria bacterium]